MTSTEFLFPAPPLPSAAIDGDARRFPVRKIFCIALNYADHAREMGKEPSRDAPFFFAKPADAVVPDGATIAFPSRTANLHHEIELVAALRGGGSNLSPERALQAVFGYAPGIDLTRRDLQQEARDLGRPWDFSKGFDDSAPLGAIVPAERVGHPSRGRITLSVNGRIRQDSDLGDMIFSTAEILSIISTYVELRPGDLIFTGTPAGVGPLQPGDSVEGAIEGVGALRLTLAQK